MRDHEITRSRLVCQNTNARAHLSFHFLSYFFSRLSARLPFLVSLRLSRGHVHTYVHVLAKTSVRQVCCRVCGDLVARAREFCERKGNLSRSTLLTTINFFLRGKAKQHCAGILFHSQTRQTAVKRIVYTLLI